MGELNGSIRVLSTCVLYIVCGFNDCSKAKIPSDIRSLQQGQER